MYLARFPHTSGRAGSPLQLLPHEVPAYANVQVTPINANLCDVIY